MPSWTRAPPESLMKTNGVPVISDALSASVTLIEWASPAEPPMTVKSWLAMCTGRPNTEPEPVMTPSAGMSALSIPKVVVRLRRNAPVSWNDPSSTRAATRSRAVSLPWARCLSSFASPPPASTLARRSASWSSRSSIVCCLAMGAP